jgi:hypothetical protein
MSSVEEGLKATLRLVIDPALENVTENISMGLGQPRPILRPMTGRCGSDWRRFHGNSFH